LKHTNVDDLSKNPMGQAIDDDDFNEEIQDFKIVQANTPKIEKAYFLFKLVRIQISLVSRDNQGN
jgi:hypothetical protein